jgi:hypothetical protein
MIERDLLDNTESLLPVRLDNADARGLSKLICTVRYDEVGPIGIADLIAQRLAGESKQNLRTLPTRIEESPSELSNVLPTHVRRPVKHSFSFGDKRLLQLVTDSKQSESAAMRSRLATELVIYLNWKHDMKLGTPYGAWRDGNNLILSTLPSLHSPQRTIECTLRGDRELALVNEWFTDSDKYAAFKHWEWQPAVKGLTANRSDLDLDREVAILILEKKGAAFGYPIVPIGNAPEKLCGWLHEDPPGDYLDWGRDPRLVPEGIGVWQAVEHTASGVGMLVFVLQGRWSAAGFLALNEGLRVLLPTRHSLDVVSQGTLRVCICLSVTPGRRNRPSNDQFDTTHATVAVRRTYAIIARMVAAGRNLPIPPPKKKSAVAPLTEFQCSLFSEATQELGNAEFADAVDQADADYADASWIELRHSYYSERIGIHSTPLRFSFGEVVTLDDALRYIRFNER